MLFMLYYSRAIPIKFNIDTRQYFLSILDLKDQVDLEFVYLRKQTFCKIYLNTPMHSIYLGIVKRPTLSVILTKDYQNIGPISEHNHSLFASTSMWKNTSSQILPSQAV